MKIIPCMFFLITLPVIAGVEDSGRGRPPSDVERTYSVRDFFRNPDKTNFHLSPNGNRVAFLKSTVMSNNVSRMNLYVMRLTDEGRVVEEKRLTQETDRDLQHYLWKDSSTILYGQDTNGDENYHVFSVNVNTGKRIDLTPFKGVRADIVDELKNDRNHIIISHNKRDPHVSDYYRVNIHTGEEILVLQNNGGITGALTDHNGKLRLALSIDGLYNTILYRRSENEKLRKIILTDYKTIIIPQFFTSDNKRFYALSNRGRDKLALVEIDPTTPEHEKVIYQEKDVDLQSAEFSRYRSVLTNVTWYGDKVHRHFFDEMSNNTYNEIRAMFPGYELYLEPDEKESRFIVYVSGDRMPGSYYLYDSNNKKIKKLSDDNPELVESALAFVKPVSYISRDGLNIHGYLTLPVNRQAENLACIIHPHGGPETRDLWGYNAEVQFLASQGFCVLQVNFRGSTGYGRQFWLAGYGQWGLKMQDDITDGVQWLIKNNIADPKRIGIYGASYGGYATLAGITFTPDLYAAAVDYVGISNLLTFLTTIPPYWKAMLEQQYAMVGHPVRDKARLEATSPALHADKIKTPLFIAQGAMDPRVNKAESDQMVEALKKRGVDVEYMVKENEGHGFNNEENRLDFYQKMRDFLVKHLKP